MLIEAGYTCSVCGEWNDTTVDSEGGPVQRYTEDCFVCCHPNSLHIQVDEHSRVVVITARFEE